MMGVSSGCGLCPWSCSGKVGAYVVPDESEPKGSLSPPDQWIIVTSARFVHLFDSSIGPVRPARIVFKPDGKHTFEVLMTVTSSGSWYDSQPPHKEISSMLDTLLENSGHVLCPGIKSYQSNFSDHIRFTPKKLRIWKNPVRYDSDECSLWHKPNNTRCSLDDDLFDVCTSCKTLKHQLNAIKKRATEASPGHKEKWVDSSSCRPFKYLSPASQTERISRNRTDRKKLRKALMKYEGLNVNIDSEQDAELQQLVATIDDKGQGELENIFTEAGECGDELRSIWEKDVASRKQFFQDQVRNSKYIIVCMYVQYVCCVCVCAPSVCWTTEMYFVGCCLATKVFWQIGSYQRGAGDHRVDQ